METRLSLVLNMVTAEDFHILLVCRLQFSMTTQICQRGDLQWTCEVAKNTMKLKKLWIEYAENTASHPTPPALY